MSTFISYMRPWLDRSIWLINLIKKQSMWIFIYTAPYLHDYNTANAQFESWNERKNSHEILNLHNYIEWNDKWILHLKLNAWYISMRVSLSMVIRVQLKKECLYIMISTIIYSSYCPFEDGGKRRDSDISKS